MLESLRQAKTVVALLTQQALGSPWVLFEIGFAKRRPGVKVFSLALGITKAEASEGPLAQTQNSADSEAEITKLVMDLLKFHLGTAPEETAILPLVRAFRRSVGRLREKKVGEKPEGQPGPPRGAEPAKVRRAEPVYEPRGFERMLGPRFFREFPLLTEKGFDGLGWLLFIAMIRDQVPWLYSIGLDLYRALSAGGKEEVRQARDLILGIVQRGVRNDWLLGALAEDDADQANRLFHFAEVVEDYLGQLSDEKLDAAP